METKKKYGKLFLSTFQLSAFTFGGGFVIIPLMRKKFVDQLHWIEEDEMMDLTAIAQSSPGAIAVNASILVGYRVAGIPGALVTAVVNMVMMGMQAGVAAVICDVVITLGGNVLKNGKWVAGVMLAAVFVAVRVFQVNIILIILICGLIGAGMTWWKLNRKKGEEKA